MNRDQVRGEFVGTRLGRTRDEGMAEGGREGAIAGKEEGRRKGGKQRGGIERFREGGGEQE